MLTDKLGTPGDFVTQRTLTGAAAADSTTLSDVNFPPADCVSGLTVERVFIYWTGTGGAATDTLVIEPLIRDGHVPAWIKTPKQTVVKDTAVEFVVGEAAQIFIRIDATATTAQNLRIRVAKSRTARPL